MFDIPFPPVITGDEPDQNQPQGGPTPPAPSGYATDANDSGDAQPAAPSLLDEALHRDRVDRGMALVREQAERVALRAELLALGADELTGHYDGYGDSGNVEDISATKGGEPIELSDDLTQRLDSFIWSLGYNRHPGFENNEGGYGDVLWNLTDDKIELDHADRYIHSEHTCYEL